MDNWLARKNDSNLVEGNGFPGDLYITVNQF